MATAVALFFSGGGDGIFPWDAADELSRQTPLAVVAIQRREGEGTWSKGGGGIGRKREKKRCEIGKFASLLDRYNGKKEALVNCEKCRGNGYFLLLTRKYYQRKMHFSHRKKGHSLNTSGVYIVKSKIIQLKMTQLKINTSSSCNLTFSHLLVTRILQSQPGYSSYSLAS